MAKLLGQRSGTAWVSQFLVALEFARACYLPKPCSSVCSIFQAESFIGLLVKIEHRNKSACSILNPVQRSRSKSTTCPRKGSVLRFQLNRTATSDSGEQKLGNNSWYDSEWITTYVCCQNNCK